MTISLRPQGPFSLPAPLSVALTDDGGEPVAFRAVWTGSAVDVDFVSDLPPTRVEAHAARVLSLDVDARDLPSLADRDPVLADAVGGRRRPAPGLLRHAVRGGRLGGPVPARLDGAGGGA